MKGFTKTLLISLMLILSATMTVFAGDFKIQYPFGTDVFLVSKDGDTNTTNLNVLTKLDASLASNVYFATDAIAEESIDFNIACAAGNHLYISGNDLACEINPSGMLFTDYPFILWNDTIVNDTYVEETELDTITELTTQVGSTVLYSGGTLTDTKWCVASGTAGAINCNVEPVIDTYGLNIGDFEFALLNNTELNASYPLRTDWTTIDDYPVGCNANEFVQTIGDTLTCVAEQQGNTTEEIQDAAGALAGGSLTYNDAGDTIDVDDDFVKNIGDTMIGNLNMSTANITLDQFSAITFDSDTPTSYFIIDATGNVIVVLG